VLRHGEEDKLSPDDYFELERELGKLRALEVEGSDEGSEPLNHRQQALRLEDGEEDFDRLSEAETGHALRSLSSAFGWPTLD
jgi:hypothetical protein